jgi:hypothetical protein
LNRRRYAADLREVRRCAAAGESYALILPLTEADGRRSRALIADPAAHAARERYRRRPQRPAGDGWYSHAFALYADDEDGSA